MTTAISVERGTCRSPIHAESIAPADIWIGEATLVRAADPKTVKPNEIRPASQLTAPAFETPCSVCMLAVCGTSCAFRAKTFTYLVIDVRFEITQD